MSRILLLIFASQFFFYSVLAQKVIDRSNPERLPWVYNKLPKSNSKFDYQVSRGEGISLKEAREDAFTSFLTNLGNIDILISSLSISKLKSEFNFGEGKPEYHESTMMANTFDIKREPFKLSLANVDEYYEYVNANGSFKYLVWQLFVYSKNGKVNAVKPETTTDYGFPPVWRSVVLPGCGQFYKKKTGKGISLLASEALLISATIYCESMRSDNMRKSAETLNINIIKEYRKRADTWELRRNITLGGAAAVYIINLLDAGLGKGQIKYAFVPGNIDLLAYKEGNINQFGIKITF